MPYANTINCFKQSFLLQGVFNNTWLLFMSSPVNQPWKNCSGDSASSGQASPWAHERPGVHSDAGHLTGKRSELMKTVKIKALNGGRGMEYILYTFFCFQSCSYQTRQTSFMPCPPLQTLTLFCVTTTNARRNPWDQRGVLDGLQNEHCRSADRTELSGLKENRL